MMSAMAIHGPVHRHVIHKYTSHRVIRWLGLHDYLVLIALAFIALGTFGFVKLMAEVARRKHRDVR